MSCPGEVLATVKWNWPRLWSNGARPAALCTPPACLRRAEPIAPGPAADRLDVLGTVDLRQEACKWVSAACSVTGGTEQCVPVSIVHGLARLNLTGENFDGDLEQSLAAKFSVKRLDPKLGGEPKDAFELAQGMLVAGGLLVEVLCQRPQPVGSLAAFQHPRLKVQIFAGQGGVRRGREGYFGIHGSKLRPLADDSTVEALLPIVPSDVVDTTSTTATESPSECITRESSDRPFETQTITNSGH